jgi:hypothetical protein
MFRRSGRRFADKNMRHRKDRVRRRAAALALSALLAPNGLMDAAAQSGDVTAVRQMTLALPHPLRAGEAAAVELQLGALGRGRVVTVTTADGRPLGSVSPFGARAGQPGGTYTLPVPPEAIRDGKLTVRLTISPGGGGPPRAPTAEEVPSVRLNVGGATR